MGPGIKRQGDKNFRAVPPWWATTLVLKGGREVLTKPMRILALTLNDGRQETKIFLTHPLHEVDRVQRGSCTRLRVLIKGG